MLECLSLIEFSEYTHTKKKKEEEEDKVEEEEASFTVSRNLITSHSNIRGVV